MERNLSAALMLTWLQRWSRS